MGSLGKLMKAAQHHPEDHSIRIENIEIPEIGPGDILVKTIAASLCHSDLMLLEGSLPFQQAGPTTIGHEGTGRVIKLGQSVTGFQIGDEIGFVNAYHACWECYGCSQHYTFCTSGKMVMQGFTSDGYFQEYCKIDQRTAYVLPAGLDAKSAAPLNCAGITAYNGVKAANLKAGDWLAIVGCGGLGQLAIRYAKDMGYRVIGIDISEATLAATKEANIDHTFNSRADQSWYTSSVRSLTSGGVDSCIVFTAAKAAYERAPELLKVGGTLVMVGCPPAKIEINAMEVAMGQYKIVGASNKISSPNDLLECALYSQKHGIVSPATFFKLDEIGKMTDIMLNGDMAGKRLAVVFDQS